MFIFVTSKEVKFIDRSAREKVKTIFDTTIFIDRSVKKKSVTESYLFWTVLFDCLQNKWAHLDAWYQPKPRFDRLEIMRFFCSTRYISKMHFFMVIFLFINRPPKTELYLIGPKLSFGLELDYYFSIAMVWLTTYKCYGRSNLLFRSEICFHIFFSEWQLVSLISSNCVRRSKRRSFQ